ncbi:helix-turn-helix transcriptional regulator [Thioalkalivibrio sp. ALMg9]|uniref:helix-turn-helix domain-containing protein n=1 Tax=Thioalkalivibrio sp. ALMg9 TaxID=1266912 RepID=UPI00037CC267|nr:helix-turn-helix transcriptional regulator [Thioalkalivibrio sp. ALMg9]
MTEVTAAPNEWLDALRAECQRTGSQATVARALGYSPAVINQVLRGTYGGNVERVREVVEGALLGITVDCPILGDIPRDACLRHQDREFAATNPSRVQLYYACRSGCLNSHLPKEY